MQFPAATIVTVAPLVPPVVQTAPVCDAKTTGLPEPPPVALSPKVPPLTNNGFAGLATKFVIVWLGRPLPMTSTSAG